MAWPHTASSDSGVRAVGSSQQQQHSTTLWVRGCMSQPLAPRRGLGRLTPHFRSCSEGVYDTACNAQGRHCVAAPVVSQRGGAGRHRTAPSRQTHGPWRAAASTASSVQEVEVAFLPQKNLSGPVCKCKPENVWALQRRVFPSPRGGPSWRATLPFSGARMG